MKTLGVGAMLAVGSLTLGGCTPDWATDNSSPFLMEIAGITGSNGVGSALLSDVGLPAVNDESVVLVNIIRKNNVAGMSVSPIEHIYVERYEVRYFRTDGRNVEGVDVPFHITGPLGNLRFHTPSPGGSGEVENQISITMVRQQAKLEPPLSNLRGVLLTSTVPGVPSVGIITTIGEVTIHARTIQGAGLVASGRIQVTFADFP